MPQLLNLRNSADLESICTQELDFPSGSDGKESAFSAEDQLRFLGREDPPGEGKGCPLQYSGLENSMDGIVLGVAENLT